MSDETKTCDHVDWKPALSPDVEAMTVDELVDRIAERVRMWRRLDGLPREVIRGDVIVAASRLAELVAAPGGAS